MRAPNQPALSPNASISFRFVYYHLGSFDYLCLPAVLNIGALCVSVCVRVRVLALYSMCLANWPNSDLHAGAGLKRAQKYLQQNISSEMFCFLMGRYQAGICDLIPQNNGATNPHTSCFTSTLQCRITLIVLILYNELQCCKTSHILPNSEKQLQEY